MMQIINATPYNNDENLSGQDWIGLEMSAVKSGDARIDKRIVKILQSMMSNPNGSIPAICYGKAEIDAAYRLFENKRVTPDKIINSHAISTLKRISENRTVLIVDDISYVDYSKKQIATELGLIGNDKSHGVVIAPLLAITPERLCLGIVDFTMWTRDPNAVPSSIRHDTQPFEEKESYHWLESYIKVCEWQHQTSSNLIHVIDRGGDIFQIYEEANMRLNEGKTVASFVIRSCHDRVILPDNSGKENSKSRKLYDKLKKETPLGNMNVNIDSAPGRSAREATMVIRAVDATLYRHSVKLTAVSMREEGTTPAGEKPLEWILLTNLKVADFDDALEVVNHYLCRWQVELFFKVLKSGCGIEKLYFQKKNRLLNCMALYAIIAWRILYITRIGRVAPDLPCTAIFTDSEWKAVYMITRSKKLPSKPISLREMMLIIGELGGFYPRKGVEFPGIKSVWTGIQRVYDFALAYEVFVLKK